MKKNRIILNILLFLATFLTCTIAGTQWAGKYPLQILNWNYGLTYAILIMTFLTAHEFGHYIASRLHGINCTLPYYIPVPMPDLFLFGTFGAVIKTRSPFENRKALFDVGVSGPIAGFIVCIIFLIIGFMTLPDKSFLYSIHPDYMKTGIIPDTGLHFGDTLVFSLLQSIFARPGAWIPPMNEIYHYPFLCVGWFGLFVTTMNMLPLGQLDGGHVTYAMFGNKQRLIARIGWWIMIFIGFGAVLQALLDLLLEVNLFQSWYMFLQDNLVPALQWLKSMIPWYFSGWGGWIFWGLLTKFLIKLDHPYVPEGEKLDNKRMVIGWISLVILLLSFSYNGLYFK